MYKLFKTLKPVYHESCGSKFIAVETLSRASPGQNI